EPGALDVRAGPSAGGLRRLGGRSPGDARTISARRRAPPGRPGLRRPDPHAAPRQPPGARGGPAPRRRPHRQRPDEPAPPRPRPHGPLDYTHVVLQVAAHPDQTLVTYRPASA